MVYLPRNRDITYFGSTNYRGNERIFGIKRKDRRQHFYVVGKSGTGKSALLSNLIYQDFQNDYGCCVIDPHGELVEEIISAIPEDRMDDVVYFNPADDNNHIGFNILEISHPRQKNLVTSGIMAIFTKIWANTWSARMEYILNNCILALLDTPDTTLLGIARILSDANYRKYIVNNIKDPVVKNFWTQEFDSWQERYRSEAIAPIQNKVGQFLSTDMIRNIVGQKKSTINIPEIMNNEKIFLVNLSKGRIGEDNSALLGGMIITKLQLAAMERVDIPEPERKDFYLYVDEFQNFVTDSFANILSEARKYRLNLTIAHQYIAQLGTFMNPIVRDAVFGNVGTMVTFRVGSQDADFLEKEYAPEFLASDFIALPNYHIYLKLMIDGITTAPFSAKTIPPLIKFERDYNKEKLIIENARILYQRKREVVEKEIFEWSEANFNLTNNEKNLNSKDNKDKNTLQNKYINDGLNIQKDTFVKNKSDNRDYLQKIGIEFAAPKNQADSFTRDQNILKPREKPLSVKNLHQEPKDLEHLDQMPKGINLESFFDNIPDRNDHAEFVNSEPDKKNEVNKNTAFQVKINKPEINDSFNKIELEQSDKKHGSEVQEKKPYHIHSFSKYPENINSGQKKQYNNSNLQTRTPNNRTNTRYVKNALPSSKSNLKEILTKIKTETNETPKPKVIFTNENKNSSFSEAFKRIKPEIFEKIKEKEEPSTHNEINTIKNEPIVFKKPLEKTKDEAPINKIEENSTQNQETPNKKNDFILPPKPEDPSTPKKNQVIDIPDDLLDQILS